MPEQADEGVSKLFAGVFESQPERDRILLGPGSTPYSVTADRETTGGPTMCCRCAV